jgi:hypothetical protein
MDTLYDDLMVQIMLDLEPRDILSMARSNAGLAHLTSKRQVLNSLISRFGIVDSQGVTDIFSLVDKYERQILETHSRDEVLTMCAQQDNHHLLRALYLYIKEELENVNDLDLRAYLNTLSHDLQMFVLYKCITNYSYKCIARSYELLLLVDDDNSTLNYVMTHLLLVISASVADPMITSSLLVWTRAVPDLQPDPQSVTRCLLAAVNDEKRMLDILALVNESDRTRYISAGVLRASIRAYNEGLMSSETLDLITSYASPELLQTRSGTI